MPVTEQQAVVFASVLTPDGAPPGGVRTADDVLHDLALDHVFERMAARAPAAADAFRVLCADEAQVFYRQDVFRALGDAGLYGTVTAFLEAVGRADAADVAAAHPHESFEDSLWHLTAVLAYTAAVESFDDALAGDPAVAGSAALTGLAGHVHAYRVSSGFTALRDQARACREGLDGVSYNVLIHGAKVSVAATDEERDLTQEVLDLFARFRTANAAETEATQLPGHSMDHVQGWVLDQVSRVHPDVFGELAAFTSATARYRDPVLARFCGEVWFYLAYLQALAPLQAAGLPTCLPTVSASSRQLAAHDTYDLALAGQLVSEKAPVVLNDITLGEGEQVIVVSGPNQGGKSTTARTFGQLHHLAALGCPVPGRDVAVFLCDRVLTAFEREERLDDLEGRLGAEVVRMHDMLQAATGRSVLVLNEVFSSTAVHDARLLTRDVLDRILDLGALAVCVTFIDELSRIDSRTVSMVSTVDPAEPARRTFRVERRVADGRAYARALAAVHGLTAEQIQSRIAGRDDEGAA